MKKIVIITNHSYMLWRFRLELIFELMKDSEVVIVTPFVGHEDDFKALGIRCIEVDVDRRGINPIKDAALFNTYRRILKKEAPDMLITYSIKPNIYAGFAARILGIPYNANVQGIGTAFQKKHVRKVVTALYKIALKRAKNVFFENEENARLFRELHIIPKEKHVVLRGAGINLENYPAESYPENGAVRFLYLGRIMKEKGIDELFSAVRRLREKYKERVALDLVGFFEDEYKEQTEALCNEGIAVFHGFKEDPRPYYRGADCIVLPSYHEGMSNVLLEAGATARPVITSDIPGCREAVEDKKTGWLCKPCDAESLYRAMCLCVEASRDERMQMGALGRKKMENEFSRENVVEETVRALFD